MSAVATRSVLPGVLALALLGGVAWILLRDPSHADAPDGPATAPAPRATGAEAPVAKSGEARLAGAPEGGPDDLYRDADVATTLGAFRFQPPNVPAAAVSRLRALVDVDPALLGHLVRVALGDEPLRPDLVPSDYPYESRQAVTWALEALGGPAARILGVRLETEPDPRTRRGIRWLLGRMGAGAAPAVEALRAAVGDTARDARERGEAIHVLGVIGGDARSATPHLLALLRDPDDPVFGYALEAIYPVAGMTDAVRDAFVDLLAIEDDDLRVDVLEVVVRQMGTDAEALRATLLGLVEHGQADVRFTTLQALEPIGVRQPAAIRLVAERLEEGDEDEEVVALAVLLASGEPGRAALLALARRTDLMPLAVRVFWALEAGDAATPVPTADLLRLFGGCDVHLLPAVADLLLERPGGLPAQDALPLLRAELRDSEGDRRWAAAYVLPCVVGDDEAVLALLDEALRDEALGESVLEALGRMSRLAVRVVPLLEAQAPHRPYAATAALGRLGHEAPLAREALRRLTGSPAPELADAARDALAEAEASSAGRRGE